MASGCGADDHLSRMTRKVWSYLADEDPWTDIISIFGWQGIGRSVIARRVMEEAKQQREPQLFDLVIYVNAPDRTPQLKLMRPTSRDEQFSEEEYERAMEVADIQEVQRRILAESGITLEPSVQQNTYTAAMQISSFLSMRRFLLIFQRYWSVGKLLRLLEKLGVPLKRTINSRRKVVITPVWGGGVYGVDIEEPLESLSADNAWRLLKEEAIDVASAINRMYPGFINANDVLEYFSCATFFHATEESGIDQYRLMVNWRCEGFMDRFLEHLRHVGEDAEDVLLRVTSVISSLLEAAGLFPTSAAVKKIVISFRGFLVRCNSGLQDAPEATEWEAAERISLSHNHIKSLGTDGLLPTCPNLSTLLLNDNILLQRISDDFFKSMTGLLILDLSNTSITSLPSSVSCLSRLRMLVLQKCRNLEVLPEFIKDLQKLEILVLRNTSLSRMVEASFDGMMSLRCLDISGHAAGNLSRLSVRGCRSLSKLLGLEELSKLVALDLSGTKIKELPYQIFNLTSMVRLDLLEMEHLKKVPWFSIRRLPKELNWHRWGLYPLKKQLQGSFGKCLISVSDPAAFDSLSMDSKLSPTYLQNFYFLVCSCEGGPKDRYARFRACRFVYSHVYDKHDISARHKRLMKYERWMEVCGGKTSLDGINEVLRMTDFFCLHGNEFIKTLFDDYSGSEDPSDLKECWIEKCQQLEIAIDTAQDDFTIMRGLKNLRLSDLAKLTVVCGGITSASFECLKHVYLECCPKLINVFSSKVELKQLELLEIKFCARLQKVYQEPNVAGQDAFPKLVELRLWELPKLKRICSEDLPMLKKLKIRGCRLLVELPLLDRDTSRAEVEIAGEVEWCERIKWEGGIKPHSIRFKYCSSFQA